KQTDMQIISLDIINSSENITNSNNIDEDYIVIEPDDQDHDDSNNKQELYEFTEPDYSSENEEINLEDLIRMLFKRVFVNNLWTCALPIEKLYYLASIYSDIYYNCNSTEDLKTVK
ncbi:29681_t:CDS:1, partial [Racocetra persica]